MSGVKDPLPELVQIPPPALLMLPFKTTSALLAHTVTSDPGSTIGPGKMIISTESLTGRQLPFWIDVDVVW